MKRRTLLFLVSVMAMMTLSTLRVSSAPVLVDLQLGYVDPHNEQDEPNRGPVRPPIIYVENGTLTFVSDCIGCELRLVNEDEVLVFSADITSFTLELPCALSGSYELQIICGNYVFHGGIEL